METFAQTTCENLVFVFTEIKAVLLDNYGRSVYYRGHYIWRRACLIPRKDQQRFQLRKNSTAPTIASPTQVQAVQHSTSGPKDIRIYHLSLTRKEADRIT